MIRRERHRSKGAYRSRRLAFYCKHTVEIVCQFTRHLLELQPINVITAIGRLDIFNLLSKEDGTLVTLCLPGRRKVEDRDEGIIIAVHEIVLADNRDIPKSFEQLRYHRFQRVGAWAARPNTESILLNVRELGLAKETRDVENLTNSTKRATGPTPVSFLPKYSPVGLTYNSRLNCRYSFDSQCPLLHRQAGMLGQKVLEAD